MIMLPIHRRRRRARSPEPLETIDTSKRVDINHDRKRLVATIVLSLLVLAFCVGWLAIGLASPGSRAAHAHLPPVLSSLPLNRHEVHLPGLPTIDVYSLRESPWWSLELGLAALLALAGMLRNLYRLQDADPALTISAKGLCFKANLLGSRVSIPWSAIHGVRFRKLKRLRRITVEVNRADHYAPRSGFTLPRPGLPGKPRPRQTVGLNLSIGDAAWTRAQACIQGFLAAPEKTAASTKTGGRNIPRPEEAATHSGAPRTEPTSGSRRIA